MNLNISKWRYFKINDLFDITAGKYHYSNEYTNGNTPYCSAKNTNNGITKKISLPPDFKGNKIVTGKIGCTTFYQPHSFCATSDVNILTPLFNMTEEIGLFIATIINKNENFRWSYGRQCRIRNTKKITIMLPAKCDTNGKIIKDKNKKFSSHGYIPDWEFMNNYIKSLSYNKISTKNNPQNIKKLSMRKWNNFKFDSLNIKIYKSKPNIKSDLDYFNHKQKNSVPFVSRTDANNSVDCWALNYDYSKIENGNAITIGDTTASIAYQKDSFITGDHIVVIRAPWLNKCTGLFIVTLLRLEKYRYSYGRSFKMDIIKNTTLKLPVDDNYYPDWKFMNEYINSLPYADKI